MLSHAMLSRARGPYRPDGEQGSVSVFTAVFAFAVIFLVALLVDGGSVLNARERAADIAEQAARAAATDLNLASLRSATGDVTIDWNTACGVAQQAIDAYAKGFNSQTTAQMTSCAEGRDPRTATVTVQVTTSPLIPAPGFSTVTVTTTQSATAACGTADQQEAC
jgi:Flp pilus assembly protein TadG